MENIKIKKGDVELKVAKRVYDVVYAYHGFAVVETKKTTRKQSNESEEV